MVSGFAGQRLAPSYNLTTPTLRLSGDYFTQHPHHAPDTQHTVDYTPPYEGHSQLPSPAIVTSRPGPQCVRRKQSLQDLTGSPLSASTPRPAPASSHTPRHTTAPNSSAKLVTPTRRPATVTPSLSSSITTAPSIAASEPYPSLPCSPLEWTWPAANSQEPIRTKRRFTPFKQAKRLPHSVGGLWEVHAAVTDLGRGPFGDYPTSDDTDYQQLKDLDNISSEASAEDPNQPSVNISRPRQRTVRFEGLSSTFASSHNSKSLEKEFATTSSLSLSRFQFPPPPSCGWQGTFGEFFAEESE